MQTNQQFHWNKLLIWSTIIWCKEWRGKRNKKRKITLILTLIKKKTMPGKREKPDNGMTGKI